MFDVSSLITKVHADTGFDVQRLKNSQPNMVEGTKIFVGYYSVMPAALQGDFDTSNSYDQNIQDLAQVIEVHLLTSVDTFISDWKKVYNSIAGWYPLADEQNISGTALLEGGAAGLQNGVFWWIDRWRINFPRMNHIV